MGADGGRGAGGEGPADDLTAEIATAQRADVAAAVKEMGAGASVLAVSGATLLHPWVVVRRLAELGLSVPGMDWRPERKERSARQKAETSRLYGEGQKRAATPHKGADP